MRCGLYMDRSARPGPCVLTGRPRPLLMRCGVLLLQLRVFWVCLCGYQWLSVKKQIRLYDAFLAKRLGCIILRIIFCLVQMLDQSLGTVVGVQTDVTLCRLGDAGSTTFLPWFVPRTEPPVQLREVGPFRGHLLTESYSDASCVSMSNRG